MRLIDIEPLQKQRWHLHRYVAGVYAAMVEEMELEEAPTVDAVPIIRCKDCKWYDTELHCKLNGFGCGMSPDWFCADGKKEEEDTEDGN